jgi:hypothetical protein
MISSTYARNMRVCKIAISEDGIKTANVCRDQPQVVEHHHPERQVSSGDTPPLPITYSTLVGNVPRITTLRGVQICDRGIPVGHLSTPPVVSLVVEQTLSTSD